MINEPEYGVLKMIDLYSFNKSLKSIWTLLTMEYGNLSLIYNWRATAAISFSIFSDNMKEISVTDPVNKENLEYWKEINFVDKASSDIAFQD